MPSLISRISNFARSPQGRRFGDQARRFASKPENRRKIQGIFGRLTGRTSQPSGRFSRPAGRSTRQRARAGRRH
jgi:hypothetical protein